ncbi:MAG: F0F1 ATP synthase subunit A, partial [Oscillospiraceae bacterium]
LSALIGNLPFLGFLKEIPLFQVGIPAVLSLYFDLFSGFIQAFIFCTLSMVFISNAMDESACN